MSSRRATCCAWKSAREALRETQRGAQGRLRFSAPDLLGVALLPAVLRRYAEDYPDVRIDISYTDKWVDPIAEGLDFAVRGGFPASSELLGARLWPYERLLCASPDYVARMGLPREPEDLVRHRLIMHTGPRVLRDWHLRGEGSIQRLRAEPALRVSTGSSLMALALAGAGVARLADWAALPEIARGTLVRVCPAYTVTSARACRPRSTPCTHRAPCRPAPAPCWPPCARPAQASWTLQPARNAARSPRFLNSR